jgi:type VI secretion system protein ImpC
MPEARQVHEAEVLLGGLLRIVDKSDESARNPDEVRYEFREGLRPLLLDAVPSGDVLDVLAEVSSYVEENLAHGLDFRAMLADPAAAAGAIDRNEGPFARITAEVLLRLGGDYARLVANLPDGEPIEKGRRQKPTSEPPQRTMNDSTAQDSTGLPPLEDETSIEFSLTIDDAQQLSADEIVELSARSSGGNRVQLDYDVRVGEAIETSELPFVIGVLADLSGRADRPLPRAMIRESYAIHEGNFETIMRAIGLRLKLELTDICHDPEHLRRSHLFGDLENLEEVGFSLNSSGEYSITVVLLFGGMSDFEPIAILDQILDQVAKLKSFYMVKKNQLDLDLEQAKYHTYKSAEDHARAIFGIRIEIVRIIIRKILSHPEFRRLEATWRGLKALVQQVGRNPRITVRVGDVSKQNLARLLEASSKVDLNTLLGKAYEEQFGLSENVPCGLLLGDYEFDHSKSDLRLLSKLSRVAAKAHCPFVAAAAPLMFGFQSFGKLPKTLEDVQTYFNSIAPSDWRSFRESENSRFVALVLPRVLGRRPYNTGTDVDKDLPAEVLGRILYATGIYPVMDFPFQEIAGPEERLPLSHERYLWISAAWALGVCLADSISKHGWPASIRGANQGGLVEKLPLHFFVNDRGSALLAGPTEVAISDPLQFELASAGFITLVPAANPDDALFRSVPTCHKPKSSNQPDARTTAEFGAQLNMILCVSRFVHYLQVILREKVGSFASAGDCEAWLNSWITQYVGDANDDNDGVSAARPLSYARIDVEEPPGKTGWFRVILSIKPAYQLEELPFPIREFFEVRRSP